MEIKVLGVDGCLTCKNTEQTIYNILAELNVAASVQKVNRAAELELYGGMSAVPGLVINGKVRSAGKVPSRAEIKKWIKEEMSSLFV